MQSLCGGIEREPLSPEAPRIVRHIPQSLCWLRLAATSCVFPRLWCHFMPQPITLSFREAAAALWTQATIVSDPKLRDRIERLAQEFDQLAAALERTEPDEAKLRGWL